MRWMGGLILGINLGIILKKKITGGGFAPPDPLQVAWGGSAPPDPPDLASGQIVSPRAQNLYIELCILSLFFMVSRLSDGIPGLLCRFLYEKTCPKSEHGHEIVRIWSDVDENVTSKSGKSSPSRIPGSRSPKTPK